jgi:thymidylate synthase
MATFIYGADGQSVYPKVITHILKNGTQRSPRHDLTLDAGFVVIELASPYHALPISCGRSLNKNIAAAEAVQLVGAFSNPDLLTMGAPGRFEPFMNGDGFHGAYGARIRNQVVWAVDKLMHDPFTRRAVVTLWHAELDNLENMNDYPCTVALQFEVRDQSLCMNVVMRSNDAWLGLPYDMFQFTQLQLSVANALGMETGRYRHTALSLHLYSRDITKAERIHEPNGGSTPPAGFGRHGVDSFAQIIRRARRTTTPELVNTEETFSERWYRDTFTSYMGRNVDGDGTDDREAVAVQS